MTIDSYTVSLLHFRGADASTTFTDEAGNTWTANGNAQIDTGVTSPLNNGGSVLILDGTGDYLSTPDSSRWRLDDGSNSNLWSIDFWLRFNGDPGTGLVGLLSQHVDASNGWYFVLSNNTLLWVVKSGGVNIVSLSNAWNPATATWYHIAFVKNGTTGYMMFVDGAQIGTTQTDTDVIPDFAGSLRIGINTTTDFLNGWMDELRISKGIARWTSNFTPPKFEYGSEEFFF